MVRAGRFSPDSVIFLFNHDQRESSLERFFLYLPLFAIGALSSCCSFTRGKNGFKRGRLFLDPERSKKSEPRAFSPHRRLAVDYIEAGALVDRHIAAGVEAGAAAFRALGSVRRCARQADGRPASQK